MASALSDYLAVFRSRRMAVIAMLGFSSGLPLALTSGTLQAWMSVAGVDIRTIGIFALVGLPYTVKFLWSPFMDRFVPPWLGRRRGWMSGTQIVLMFCIGAMGFASPQHALWALAALSMIVAFTSASQDIVVDAYRTDLLHEKERGVGAALFVFGYRIAMLVSGALALILSDHIGWKNTYLVMAGCVLLGFVATLSGPEPEKEIVPPKTLSEAVVGPLKDYLSRPAALLVLCLIILYKLGDAYAGTMTTPFLIRGLGFSATDVGTVNKGFGLAALIVGAMFGGTLMVRLGLYRSLLYFGVLQAVSNLSFMFLAWTGKSYPVMIFAVGFENLSGGMGTAAFVSLLMALCNHRFSATQYALLSSLASLGRIVIAPSSGFLVSSIGWAAFFLVTAGAALPGLWMLVYLKKAIGRIGEA
ncbi:MAG TPA: MFS transporter [Thermodesulfovibrionales bacterium]|nr:MFS transporter [Thermodesulfovibrionales bacterium]